MKSAQMRLRLEPDLHRKFIEKSRENGVPAAKLMRDFISTYVGEQTCALGIREKMTHQSVQSDKQQEIIRPIQYLGSKLRSISPIIEFAQKNLNPSSTVLDIFTGTSVVAQAFANIGMNVIASDVMGYSYHFSRSLLGSANGSHFRNPESFFAYIDSHLDFNLIQKAYGDWIKRERDAVNSSDAESLFKVSRDIPQIWRRLGQTPEQVYLFDNLSKLKGQKISTIPGIVSTHYAGTYFGIFQSQMLDTIRIETEKGYITGELSDWDYSASITALLFAASSASFTPGKHFAQYHQITDKKDLAFHKKRILLDRSVDISEKYKEMLERIWSRAAKNNPNHVPIKKSMEELCQDNSDLSSVDLVYADPPYTAQQYSRFYHVPEIISEYRVPNLQVFRGKITKGLYDNSRFNSRFSSKRSSPKAFEDLASLSRGIDSDLVISYSESAEHSTGNSRMIDLDSLKTICRKYFPVVRDERLEHSYRQFNSSNSAVVSRSDDEVLLVCERK
ncbi:DNA adenine methylase [Vreelandella populi]|uniref:DNA adenine methylase n=1 Tax=Vreelandella populi TaxID=2498858 RepID=UPI000F8E32CA|nr:DNA adenine methylase [Halomonas populi]RUR36654.1 hypothetical protein ELY25_13505 [Halomonas populi]